MSARARAVTGITILSVFLVLYFVFAGMRAVVLLQSGTVIAITMGVALIVLPLIGAWALARELWFGYRMNALANELERLGQLPEEEVDTLPSGRPVREQADAVFPKYQADAEARPESWQAWMRLGIVYDACGDRPRARRAIRQAIALYRN